MSHAVKRSFPTETLSSSFVIDLTSDNEDVARPPKRQRSESNATPRAHAQKTPIIVDVSKKTPTASATTPREGNATTSSTLYSKYDISNNNGGSSGKTVPPKSSMPRTVSSQHTNSIHNDRNKDVFAQNGARTLTATIPQPKNNVTHSVKGLTLRPSPGPLVIDLETDSDRATKRSKKKDGSRGSSMSSSNRVQVVHTSESSAKFVMRDAQPIKFDPAVVSPPRKNFTQNHTVSKTEHYSTQSRPSENSSIPAKFYSPAKPEIRVVLPPNPKEKALRQREIIQKIRDDPTYIDRNAEEVYNITGVKLFPNKDLTKEIYDKARQKKRRSPVERSKVLLDFDELSKPASPTISKISLIHPRKQTRSILNERFQRGTWPPLTFENRINDRRINGKFQFVSNYIYHRKVEKNKQTPHPHRSCSCENGICGQDCNCLITQLVTKVDDVEHEFNVRTYQRHPHQKDLIILGDALIDDTTHKARIFECGDYCRCMKDCINRVVQKGRIIPLQIFETGKYGFGVRSSVPIVRGQFIDIYLGEVLTELELSKREAAAEEDTPSYIMSLDAFHNNEKNMLHVDGENFGTVTRFVNHSCDPNCKTVPVLLPKGTKQLHHVAFFAVKDIPIGTELTIDYDPDVLVDNEVNEEVIVQCQCGSANCRKRLWAPGKEQRRRKKRWVSNKDDD